MKKNVNERYMVHDELLYELYKLKLDTIKYQIIGGVQYLVNTFKSTKYEIGFKVRIKEEIEDEVPSGTPLNQFFGIISAQDPLLVIDWQDILEKEYGKYLCLSNIEKYLLNVLLDKYLDNPKSCIISLKEIEIMYRSTSMSYRNITLNKLTYSKYIDTLISLCSKELYIKTNSNFRRKCYGVNNIETNQSLLKIQNMVPNGTNNFEFSYSLGVLGNILYNSKRYSVLAPPQAFKVNLNQVKRNLVAMWIARKVYIEQGLRAKSINPKSGFDIDVDSIIRFVDDPFSPIGSNYERYKENLGQMISRILFYMKKQNKIPYYTYETKKEKVYLAEAAYIYGQDFLDDVMEHSKKKHPKITFTTSIKASIYFVAPDNYELFKKYIEQKSC